METNQGQASRQTILEESFSWQQLVSIILLLNSVDISSSIWWCLRINKTTERPSSCWSVRVHVFTTATASLSSQHIIAKRTASGAQGEAKGFDLLTKTTPHHNDCEHLERTNSRRGTDKENTGATALLGGRRRIIVHHHRHVGRRR